MRESMEERQQGTIHMVCKKSVGDEVAFNQAKTYITQVAKNYGGKHATEVARKQTKVCMKNINKLDLKVCKKSSEEVGKTQ